jgi:hypothetical protein
MTWSYKPLIVKHVIVFVLKLAYPFLNAGHLQQIQLATMNIISEQQMSKGLEKDGKRTPGES